MIDSARDSDSARNWIMWPEDSGKVGVYVGGLALSYPVVRSRTHTICMSPILRG